MKLHVRDNFAFTHPTQSQNNTKQKRQKIHKRTFKITKMSNSINA